MSQNSGRSPSRIMKKGRLRKQRDKAVTDSRVGARPEEAYYSEEDGQDQASIDVNTRNESL